MSVAFDGMDNLVVTFRCSGTVEAGSPVILSANDTVADGGRAKCPSACCCRSGGTTRRYRSGVCDPALHRHGPGAGLAGTGDQRQPGPADGDHRRGGQGLPGGLGGRGDKHPGAVSFEQKGEGTMAYSHETVRLDKGMYGEAGHSFTQVLEKCDPSSSTGDAAGALGRLSAAAEAI